jgi:hypothetical protein
MKRSVQALVLLTMGTAPSGCMAGVADSEVDPIEMREDTDMMGDGGGAELDPVSEVLERSGSQIVVGPVGPSEPSDAPGASPEEPSGGTSGGGGSGGTSGAVGGLPGAGAGTSFACPAAQVTGAVHYVCDCGPGSAAGCVPGNDGNTGDSAQSPWRSYEKARSAFGSMQAGETIALCRGGAFSVGSSTRWMNNRCRADKRCVVRDYTPSWASATTGAPIIAARGDQRIFSLENSGAPAHE